MSKRSFLEEFVKNIQYTKFNQLKFIIYYVKFMLKFEVLCFVCGVKAYQTSTITLAKIYIVMTL